MKTKLPKKYTYHLRMPELLAKMVRAGQITFTAPLPIYFDKNIVIVDIVDFNGKSLIKR